ncbi:MAG: hypothetical protein JST70_10240 [Bacteroidetes bacterium]|nr:hypothetical protein [Bacteroidota bacterium]
MSLLNGGKNNNKKGGKATKGAGGTTAAKPVIKPGKTANISRKPPKTGGTRGS